MDCGKAYSPPKMEIFFWMAILSKINVRGVLVIRGILGLMMLYVLYVCCLWKWLITHSSTITVIGVFSRNSQNGGDFLGAAQGIFQIYCNNGSFLSMRSSKERCAQCCSLPYLGAYGFLGMILCLITNNLIMSQLFS